MYIKFLFQNIQHNHSTFHIINQTLLDSILSGYVHLFQTSEVMDLWWYNLLSRPTTHRVNPFYSHKKNGPSLS